MRPQSPAATARAVAIAQAIAGPQSKLPERARPVRAHRDPRILPVPYHVITPEQLAMPHFAPPPPPRGFWLHHELPRRKLRGLGPADSLILRHAIARRLIDPDRTALSPLIPYGPADPQQAVQTGSTSLNLLECPATLEPDAIITMPPTPPPRPKPPPKPPPPAPTPPAVRRPPPTRALPPLGHRPGPAELFQPPPQPYPVQILEVKPNAGYVALGQVLAYVWTWNRIFGQHWPATATILTDLPRPYAPGLYAAHHVDLLSLGGLLVEPPPWPT